MRSLNRTFTRQAGFSLAEVLIAVLIFSASLIALTKFTSSLFSTNSYAQQRTEALSFGQQKLADLQSFARLNATTGYRAYDDIVAGSDSVVGTNATYTRTWTLGFTTNLNYKIVLLSVTWTAQDGSNKTLNLSSIIARIDPAAIAQTGTNSGSAGQITP